MHTSLWAANWLGRIAAKIMGIACISSLHNHAELNGKVRHLFDLVAPQPSRFIAVSSQVKQSFGYARTTIIRNGIAPYQGIHKSRADIDLDEHHFIIGSVGRFHSDKQYDLLIRSFACVAKKYDQARLLLMGSGPQEQVLKKLAQELGVEDKITFIIGQLAQPYYALFDCFVLSSKNEGISLALLEAMSMGVPCIITHDTKKHAVITHEQTGIIARQTERDIAEKIIQLNMQPDWAKHIGLTAQQMVQNDFNLGQTMREYAHVFNQE